MAASKSTRFTRKVMSIGARSMHLRIRFICRGTDLLSSQSKADAALELYADCASDPDQTQDNSFSVGVRLEFRAQSDGTDLSTPGKS